MSKKKCRYLAAFLACRLIPLDKQSGVRPIGIGEALRQVIRKSVIKLLRKDIKTAGSLQLYLVKTLEVNQQFTQFIICSMTMTLKQF